MGREVTVVGRPARALYGLWVETGDDGLDGDMSVLTARLRQVVGRQAPLPFYILRRGHGTGDKTFSLFVGYENPLPGLERVELPEGPWARAVAGPELGLFRGQAIGKAKRYVRSRWMPGSGFTPGEIELERRTEASLGLRPEVELFFALEEKGEAPKVKPKKKKKREEVREEIRENVREETGNGAAKAGAHMEGFGMKVILVNGSPNREGCTHTALKEVARALEAAGIDTEIFWLGKEPIRGCVACNGCWEKSRCVYNDKVNQFLDKAEGADGFVFGSPVHYAGAGGTITSFLDRAFFAGGEIFRLKPGTAVVSARRAGTTTALDQLNKYFTIAEMPVVSSKYWNMVHGSMPEEVLIDFEGMQTMRVLGRNMAYLLKCLAAGREMGVAPPEQEEGVFTNFIR